MSGPKLSEAELAAQRQAELERQRQEELRRLAAAQRKYNDEKAALQEMAASLDAWLNGETMKSLQASQPHTAESVRKQLAGLIDQMTAVQVAGNSPEAYLEAAQMTAARGEKLFQECSVLIQNEDRRHNARCRQQKAVQSSHQLDLLLAGIRADQPVNAIVDSFEFDGDIQQLRSQLQWLARYFKRWESCPEPDLPDALKKASRELGQYARAADLKSRSDAVKDRVEALLNQQQEYRRLLTRKTSLYDQYLALCSVTGSAPKPSDQFHCEADLKKEIDTLQEEYRRKDEMDFIADTINAVMLELGYTFVSSSALRRKDGTEYDYSLYQADEHAGVRVYTDESGAVMMQVTSLGDGAMSQSEIDDNYQLQLDFCASHPDIVNALAQKGVILKKRNYAPPDKKYASKQAVSHQGKKDKADRRRRRRDGQTMRKMRND